MNIGRAKEILALPEIQNVQFDGKQVVIQHVDEHNETARIYFLTDPENEKTVPIQQLEEY